MAEKTKELAKKLNSIKTRTFIKKETKTKMSQRFRYLIVIDFESTCWEDKHRSPSPEIIEFPAVLTDLRSGTLLDQFKQYIIPSENPNLSKFCTKLTGITDEILQKEGVPISTGLYLFRRWIDNIVRKYDLILVAPKIGKEDSESGPNTAVLTWSNWDLQVCLATEALRKNLSKPKYLDAWIDCREVYKRFYSRNPQGLNGALNDLGLIFEGNEHSGIDDARNTAKLALKMSADGVVFGITQTTKGKSVSDDLMWMHKSTMQ